MWLWRTGGIETVLQVQRTLTLLRTRHGQPCRRAPPGTLAYTDGGTGLTRHRLSLGPWHPLLELARAEPSPHCWEWAAGEKGMSLRECTFSLDPRGSTMCADLRLPS